MDSNEPAITPLFCVKTAIKNSLHKLVINFKANDAIQPPEIDFEEEKLIEELRDPTQEIENYKIPLQLSQIFWSKPKEKSDKSTHGDTYVIDVQINDKFAFRKVVPNEIIRHFVIAVSLNKIEEKYSSQHNSRMVGQFLGHDLVLDQLGYKVVASEIEVERSDELVSNKISVVANESQVMYDSYEMGDEGIVSYDLHFRPKSMLLTCSLNIDKLPSKVSFNDDRFIVESAEKILIDVCLPLNIDLKTPVKYKYNDVLGLFRIVFKVSEPSSESYNVNEESAIKSASS